MTRRNLFNWESKVKYPYFRLRGKSINKQQAFNIISSVDDFGNRLLCEYEIQYKEEILSLFHLYTHWVNQNNECDRTYGWVSPNGSIGINGNMGKYLNLAELTSDITKIQAMFPYLNFIIAITNLDIEQVKYNYLEDSVEISNDNFTDYIHIGILVKNKEIKVMNASKTKIVYKEYEKLYQKEDNSVYEPIDFNDCDEQCEKCVIKSQEYKEFVRNYFKRYLGNSEKL